MRYFVILKCEVKNKDTACFTLQYHKEAKLYPKILVLRLDGPNMKLSTTSRCCSSPSCGKWNQSGVMIGVPCALALADISIM